MIKFIFSTIFIIILSYFLFDKVERFTLVLFIFFSPPKCFGIVTEMPHKTQTHKNGIWAIAWRINHKSNEEQTHRFQVLNVRKEWRLLFWVFFLLWVCLATGLRTKTRLNGFPRNISWGWSTSQQTDGTDADKRIFVRRFWANWATFLLFKFSFFREYSVKPSLREKKCRFRACSV